jgi:outer membrane lipopolysaccharide assembly protein LptE/RlpB
MDVLLRLALTLVAVLSGCGYRPVIGALPPGVDSVHVPPVANATARAGLAAPLTSALRKRLARSGIEVTRKGAAHARLEVEILEVGSEPGMVSTEDGRLVPEDAIWSVRAVARLVDPGGRPLAEPVWISRRGRASTGGSVHAEQALGHRRRLQLLDELADGIVAELFER